MLRPDIKCSGGNEVGAAIESSTWLLVKLPPTYICHVGNIYYLNKFEVTHFEDFVVLDQSRFFRLRR